MNSYFAISNILRWAGGIFGILTVLFWSITYIFIVIAGFYSKKERKVSMPYVSGVLNIRCGVAVIVPVRVGLDQIDSGCLGNGIKFSNAHLVQVRILAQEFFCDTQRQIVVGLSHKAEFCTQKYMHIELFSGMLCTIIAGQENGHLVLPGNIA